MTAATLQEQLPGQTKFDFSEDTPTNDKLLLREIATAVQKQADAEKEVATKQLELSKAQDTLRLLCEKTVPELMGKLGLGEVKTENGIKVKINEKVRTALASVEEEKQEKAFEWLIERGFERLIKREFKIEFGKEELSWAKKFETDLRRRKKPVNCVRKEMIHPSTLSTTLKAQLEDGIDVPLELFGAFVQKFSHIDVPKEPKRK